MVNIVLTRPVNLSIPQINTTSSSVSINNGQFSYSGDSQKGIYFLRAITTNATVTEAFLNGPYGSNPLYVTRDNCIWTFRISASARRTDAIGGCAGFKFEGIIRRDTGIPSIQFQGNPTKSIMGRSNGAWDVNIAIDNTAGALRVNVTGETGKTIWWFVLIETTEMNT